MAGRIRIPPYRPLGVSTQAVPGGGYFDVDASAGQFGPSPLLQLGLQAAEGVAGIASVVSEQIGRDDEATVKAADMRLGEAEQALFFDPDNGYLNTQGEAALTRAEVRDKAERHGWDSPLTEAALSQQTSHTLVSAVEAAVERDPGRAQALRTRHDQHIEAPDRAALDALLAEAQTRQRAQAASAEILNAAPPDGEQPTSQWRLRQAEAIPDPDVRAATIRRVRSAAAADEARARALGEQVLARVLKDHLTDPSQIPVREWVALDAERRQAIETRIDHNARGTEPASNPALVDELATEMTQAPSAFARRDLVLTVTRLPLPQWQRFHDWQAGIRRNDPATEDQLYAIKRGLQLASKILSADDSAMNYRAELVEEIDTWRRVTGKSRDDADIAGMLRRHVPTSYPHSAAPRQPPSNSRSQSRERDCYAECAHLLPSPSGDLQSSEFRKCYRQCKGSL